MTSIKLQQAGFALPDRDLFQDIHMQLGQGRQALVGPNGVGKSTLAKIIAGELGPTSGRLDRGAAVVMLGQLANSGDTRTVGERLERVHEALGRSVGTFVKGSGRARLNWRAWIQLVPAHDDARLLSGGEMMRLRLLETMAEIARLEADGHATFLILDEPTNDLDREGRALVREWIESRDHGLLMISHDRELLQSADEIFELSSLGLKTYPGPYDVYAELTQANRQRAEAAVDLAQRDLKKKRREKNEKQASQEKRLRNGQKKADRGDMPRILIGARKRRAQQTMGRIQSDELDRVEAAHRRATEALQEKPLDPFLRLDFEGEARPASQVLVVARDLQLSHGKAWPRPLTFQLKARDRIWLQGESGSGKSSLLKILMGGGRDVQGEIWRAPLLSESDRIGFLDQRQSRLELEDTPVDTIARSTRLAGGDIRNELAFYGFTNERALTKVRNLSGGERLRLALAQIFLGQNLPSLLVLDEPTNNLDFQSQNLLRQAIEYFPGGIILVTHDEVFGSQLQNFEVMTLT